MALTNQPNYLSREPNIIAFDLKNLNRKSFEKLYFEYSEGLVRFAESFLFNRQEAEDVVQNLFIYMWDNAKQLEIKTSIKSYLYQSTRNRCLNIIRDLKVQDRRELLFLEAMMNSHNVDDSFDEELFAKLEKAMNDLPQKMLHVFRLKYLEGKKIAEIAESLQITESTVKTQLQRAREKIGKSFLSLIIYMILVERLP